MDAAGLSDRVLVATISEFGRRLRENASGLDHGSASSMLMFGPVTPGRHGEPSPLGGLDDCGNLRTTVPFDRYLATLAQDRLGVEAGSVLPGNPQLTRTQPGSSVVAQAGFRGRQVHRVAFGRSAEAGDGYCVPVHNPSRVASAGQNTRTAASTTVLSSSVVSSSFSAAASASSLAST